MTRPVTEVACGVLINRESGLYLLGSRPEGKPYAGYWEFPGGKLEVGETVHEALKRELTEELDLHIGESFPWFVLEHDYPHAYVRLHFRRVFSWIGTARGLENQSFCWFKAQSDLSGMKLLPMDALIVSRIFLPDVVAVASVNQALSLHGLAGMPEDVGAVVGDRDELLEAAEAGLRYAIARPGTEAELLQNEDNPMPVYVFGCSEDVVMWQRRGAHGVLVLTQTRF